MESDPLIPPIAGVMSVNPSTTRVTTLIGKDYIETEKQRIEFLVENSYNLLSLSRALIVVFNILITLWTLIICTISSSTYPASER